MKKAMLALAATSVIALSACGTSSSDKIVTSKAGDITKEEFYNEMKQKGGSQVLQSMVMEKVLIKNYKVDEKEVDKKYDEMKKQVGDQFDKHSYYYVFLIYPIPMNFSSSEPD